MPKYYAVVVGTIYAIARIMPSLYPDPIGIDIAIAGIVPWCDGV